MSGREPTVGVAGLGYMGLASALAFAHHGRRVRGFDILPERRAQLSAGHLPIHEPGFGRLLRAELASGRFRVSESWRELVDTCETVFLCVQTPSSPSGRIDLGPMRKALGDLGRALRLSEGRRLVVVKSTVVPGTTEEFVRPYLLRASRRSDDGLGVASNPEFLAEGTMLRDAMTPDRIVLGVRDARDRRWLRLIYRSFRVPIDFMTPTEAELVKYTSNAGLAMRVAFANEVARLAERLGSDVDTVMRAVGEDPRIGPRFLSAGPGFGGSCFEKDLRAFVARARQLNADVRLLRSILPSNEVQTLHAARLVTEALGGDLTGRRVAVLGLAFKVGTDDARESRAIPIVRYLSEAGARVSVHDPVALRNFSMQWSSFRSGDRGVTFAETVEKALEDADAAVLQVAWPEYLRWPRRWSKLMRRPLLVDLRRAMPSALRIRGDFEWVGLGVGVSRGGSTRRRQIDRAAGPTGARSSREPSSEATIAP